MKKLNVLFLMVCAIRVEWCAAAEKVMKQHVPMASVPRGQEEKNQYWSARYEWPDMIDQLSLSYDERFIATATNQGAAVRIWDVGNGQHDEPLKTNVGNGINGLTFLSNNTLVVRTSRKFDQEQEESFSYLKKDAVGNWYFDKNLVSPAPHSRVQSLQRCSYDGVAQICGQELHEIRQRVGCCGDAPMRFNSKRIFPWHQPYAVVEVFKSWGDYQGLSFAAQPSHDRTCTEIVKHEDKYHGNGLIEYGGGERLGIQDRVVTSLAANNDCVVSCDVAGKLTCYWPKRNLDQYGWKRQGCDSEIVGVHQYAVAVALFRDGRVVSGGGKELRIWEKKK